jgi:hypothetical protein
MEKMRNINFYVGKPEWKHMLQRSNSRWNDDIKTDLKPTGAKRIQ